MYAYAIAYLTATHTGYQELVSSAYLTQLVASAPFWLKVSLKAPIAAAFNFHTWNGIRHLLWDKGYCELRHLPDGQQTNLSDRGTVFLPSIRRHDSQGRLSIRIRCPRSHSCRHCRSLLALGKRLKKAKSGNLPWESVRLCSSYACRQCFYREPGLQLYF